MVVKRLVNQLITIRPTDWASKEQTKEAKIGRLFTSPVLNLEESSVYLVRATDGHDITSSLGLIEVV